jgi:hypothetical protein
VSTPRLSSGVSNRGRLLEQAAEFAKGSPFLRNNPDGTVLVRPILQMG